MCGLTGIALCLDAINVGYANSAMGAIDWFLALKFGFKYASQR
ncbi:MAG: hypothetical protein ACXW00_01580 [Methylobacter sp.]|jgi:hypothetical protein